MEAISKWLLHDDQEELFEILVAIIINLLFLVLITLLLWPLGRLRMAFSLAKGYGILWIVVLITGALVNRIQGLFRVNLYQRSNVYVISNLAVSCFLQVGWSAFAALTFHSFVNGAPAWITVVLYLLVVLSCLIAFFAVSSLYQGEVYRLISLPLALIGFLVFSAWPESGQILFGWFFDLF